MSITDWTVLFLTLTAIAVYGIYRTRNTGSTEGYIRGSSDNTSWGICLSVMATQASAITFLSTPGQAYADGMRFVQFYLGLPLAMILISAFFIPMYYKLKVYTAYEYLETRFDLKTRILTAALFLVQRSLAAGITIYAPSIILSQILGWDLHFTILFIGLFVTVYIVSGGSRAVMITHRQQMAVIFAGMFVAFGFLLYDITRDISFGQTLHVAGTLGKMHITDFRFDLHDRYTIWSGLIGGLFLQLSYFGTDQSQVARYLGGRSMGESRLGLLFNGLIKVPMQFFILFTGVLVFVFYQLHQPPPYFNQVALQNTEQSTYGDSLSNLETALDENFNQKRTALDAYLRDPSQANAFTSLQSRDSLLRAQVTDLVRKVDPHTQDDHDYIFMHFVTDYLPIGLIGLLFAMIFSAGMSSSSSEISALAGTFSIDIYKRLLRRDGSDVHYLRVSRLFTIMFGLLTIAFAFMLSRFENLIQAVNIIGSLFYGTILGIFLTALMLKRVRAGAVFAAALIAQACIFYIDFAQRFHWHVPVIQVGFLWYNVIAALLVMVLAWLFSVLRTPASA